MQGVIFQFLVIGYSRYFSFGKIFFYCLKIYGSIGCNRLTPGSLLVVVADLNRLELLMLTNKDKKRKSCF